VAGNVRLEIPFEKEKDLAITSTVTVYNKIRKAYISFIQMGKQRFPKSVLF
jgi:hypothetical protein